MSDVNTRALARELVAQMIHIQKKDIDIQNEWWDNFNNLIFKQRPLAIQYARSVGVFQHKGLSDDSYDKVRHEWQNYYLNSTMIYQNIGEAINLITETDQILLQVGDYFSTNAILGDGITELFDAIIFRDLQKLTEGEGGKKKRVAKRKITKF